MKEQYNGNHTRYHYHENEREKHAKLIVWSIDRHAWWSNDWTCKWTPRCRNEFMIYQSIWWQIINQSFYKKPCPSSINKQPIRSFNQQSRELCSIFPSFVLRWKPLPWSILNQHPFQSFNIAIKSLHPCYCVSFNHFRPCSLLSLLQEQAIPKVTFLPWCPRPKDSDLWRRTQVSWCRWFPIVHPLGLRREGAALIRGFGGRPYCRQQVHD